MAPTSPGAARRWGLAVFGIAWAAHLAAGVAGHVAGLDVRALIVFAEIFGILAVALIAARLLGLSLRDAFAWRPARAADYAVAVAAAVPLQLAGGAMQQVIIAAWPGSGDFAALLEQTLDELVRTRTTSEWLMLVAGGVVVAAVCEEFLFRGLLLHLFSRDGGWWPAIAVTGGLFAAFHMDPIGLLPRTLVGVYLGLLVWRSGSIFPAIVAHGANNFVALMAAPRLDGVSATAGQLAGLGVLGAVAVAGILAVYLWYRPVQGPPTVRAQGQRSSPGQ